MFNASNLAKKTDYNTKINETEKKITDQDCEKYIAAQESNKLTAEHFIARLAQENLASESNIANFVKKTDFDDKLRNLNKKITSNKTKHVLVKNEFKKYRHLTQVFLLAKATFLMMEHNFT